MLKPTLFAFLLLMVSLIRADYVINADKTDADEDDAPVIANIINGQAATLSEYPFIGQLYYSSDNKNFKFSCTASLINPNWLVTAAHCISDQNGNTINPISYKVAVGRITLATGADLNNLIQVIQITTFGFKSSPANDLALLKLANPISNVTPIKVYPYIITNNLPLEVAGFGVTKSGSSVPSNILLKTSIGVSSSKNCSAYNDLWGNNSGPQFCTESYNGNDSCQGDSGGPIVAMVNSKRVIAGVTSFGMNKDSNSNVDCGENVIAYYTRVAYFLRSIAIVLGVSLESLYT
ncbi:hypothetical protein BB560_003915 [Smittium megazygosporum]|uniref:Peptidase S1 domain-containing protein n=1 Tax=Smittium megazygosporum TaxID=133381 RepID=A0A2T9ZAT6_9FUNG|nr:hypothetical protein BB560_006601 [Smittium megazygosporum]PVV01657.1 hypothetical protein BB560_003915 [Smittium megazygosporum]